MVRVTDDRFQRSVTNLLTLTSPTPVFPAAGRFAIPTPKIFLTTSIQRRRSHDGSHRQAPTRKSSRYTWGTTTARQTSDRTAPAAMRARYGPRISWSSTGGVEDRPVGGRPRSLAQRRTPWPSSQPTRTAYGPAKSLSATWLHPSLIAAARGRRVTCEFGSLKELLDLGSCITFHLAASSARATCRRNSKMPLSHFSPVK